MGHHAGEGGLVEVEVVGERREQGLGHRLERRVEPQRRLRDPGHLLLRPDVGRVDARGDAGRRIVLPHVPELLEIGGRAALGVLDAERREPPRAALDARVAGLDVLGQGEEALPAVVGGADQGRVDPVPLDVQESELPQALAQRLDQAVALRGGAGGVVGKVDGRDGALGHGPGLLGQIKRWRHGTGRGSIAAPTRSQSRPPVIANGEVPRRRRVLSGRRRGRRAPAGRCGGCPGGGRGGGGRGRGRGGGAPPVSSATRAASRAGVVEHSIRVGIGIEVGSRVGSRVRPRRRRCAVTRRPAARPADRSTRLRTGSGRRSSPSTTRSVRGPTSPVSCGLSRPDGPPSEAPSATFSRRAPPSGEARRRCTMRPRTAIQGTRASSRVVLPEPSGPITAARRPSRSKRSTRAARSAGPAGVPSAARRKPRRSSRSVRNGFSRGRTPAGLTSRHPRGCRCRCRPPCRCRRRRHRRTTRDPGRARPPAPVGETVISVRAARLPGSSTASTAQTRETSLPETLYGPPGIRKRNRRRSVAWGPASSSAATIARVPVAAPAGEPDQAHLGALDLGRTGAAVVFAVDHPEDGAAHLVAGPVRGPAVVELDRDPAHRITSWRGASDRTLTPDPPRAAARPPPAAPRRRRATCGSCPSA